MIDQNFGAFTLNAASIMFQTRSPIFVVVSHGIKASTFVIVPLCVLLIQHTEPRFAGGVEAVQILRGRRRRCTVHLIVLYLERAAKHILV